MKTPEQIAREVMKFHRGRPDSQVVANIPSMIAVAIKADRAQRQVEADRQNEYGALLQDNYSDHEAREIVWGHE